MKRTACIVACVGAASALLGAGGSSTGCGGGTLGGNGGGAPITGAGGAIVPGTGTAGTVTQGSAGDIGSGPGAGGDVGLPPRGGAGGMAGVIGAAGSIGPLGGSDGGAGGSGGAGGAITCPATTSPICGSSCGNGVVDTCIRMVGRDCHLAYVTEDCDGADFGPRTCRTLGYASGDLVCSPVCTLDYDDCSACAAPGAFVAACGDSPIQVPNIVSFGLAASDDQVAAAFVNQDSMTGAFRLTFTQLTAELALVNASTLDDTAQAGPVYGVGLYQAVIAPIGPGWIVAACSDDDVYLHLIDASGRDLGRTVVSHATDPTMQCHARTLVLAARPSGGPLLLWQTAQGLSASVIADNGRSASAPVSIAASSEGGIFGASAAWIAGAFQVAAGVGLFDVGGEAIRLVTVQSDGTAQPVADVLTTSVDGAPRIATGAADLRVVYPGVPAGPPVGFGQFWQRFDVSGKLVQPPVLLTSYPDFFGEAPAIALGDDTAVLVDGYGGEELAVIRVGLDGSIVTPLRDVAKAPAGPLTSYDMVRRGPELVVGWLSSSTGAFQLARVTP
ncbi:MAG TPA: hypothetical protein VIF57_00520 [Polyangia bacterium]|jgi:hypothetical protein